MGKLRIEIALPFPPSINNYYYRTRSGVFLKKKAKKYRDDILVLYKGKIDKNFGKKRIKASLFFYPPNNIKRDLDNLAKAVFDVCQALEIYENDCQIDELLFKRMPVVNKGLVNAIFDEI